MVDGPLQPRRRLDVNVERMAIGLAIMALGVALVAGQFGGLVVASRLWPLLLIALGLGRLVAPPTPRIAACDVRGGVAGIDRGLELRGFHGRRGGWLIVIGVWLLLDQLRILRAGDTWPLLLVAFGAATVWKATAARRRD